MAGINTYLSIITLKIINIFIKIGHRLVDWLKRQESSVFYLSEISHKGSTTLGLKDGKYIPVNKNP